LNTRAKELSERIKITAHLRTRLRQRTDLTKGQIHTLVGRVARALTSKDAGRYFVYSKSFQYGILVHKTQKDLEYITAYQKGKKSARDAKVVLSEDMSHLSQEAVQFTLEHFEGLYADDELQDFYSEIDERCFFLIEVEQSA